jgi:hypothetical protein
MCSARLEKRRKVWDSILFGCLVLSFLGAAVQLRRFWEQNTTDRDGFIRGTELQAPKHHSHYQVGFLQAIMPVLARRPRRISPFAVSARRA